MMPEPVWIPMGEYSWGLVQRCPICRAGLVASVGDAFDEVEPGRWAAAEVQIDCVSEPDIDSDEWMDWHLGHYRTPYVDWLPLESSALKSINSEYAFYEAGK